MIHQRLLLVILRTLLVLLLILLSTQTLQANPLKTVTGDVQIVVEGYIIVPDINRVIFQALNAQNAYTTDTSQSQTYSIQSTFSNKSSTPNVSIVASIDHGHVDAEGAYLVNADESAKVHFTVDYASCGAAQKRYAIVTTGSSPVPIVILKNKEVSSEACQKQPGQLFFIRSALKTTPTPEPLPPAGTYTGQITLTVQATSET